MSTSTIATTPSSRAFISDNMAGASPEIARAVADAAAGQVLPYGNDPFTDSARRRLGEIFGRDVDVFPVSTGSAANGLSLAALTPPWGSVLSHPDSQSTPMNAARQSSSPTGPSSSASGVPTARSTPARCGRRCGGGPVTCTVCSRPR